MRSLIALFRTYGSAWLSGASGVALVVIQAVAIGGDAGHENVPRQAVAAGPRGRLHLRRGGPALPVVDVVVNDLET